MWKDLTMSQRADMMDLYLSKGITSLDDMRNLYDSSISDTAQGTSFSDGGSIHIKPENRGKFTALKERTGHSATWFKEHGTPAQRKMATFALNAAKWKHGYGGHIYDGTTEDSQLMNTDGGPFSYIQRMLSDAQNMSRFARKPSYEDALRQAGERVEKERENRLTTSNDNTWVEGRHGKQKNKHLKERGIKGAKSHRLWEEEHPVLSTVETAASAAPLAVAAYPFVAGAGELAYGIGSAAAATTAGQTLLPWIDAGLTSYFGAHGLNHAINEGIDGWGDAAMTALELTPLGRLAKPVYEELVQPGMRLFNSPLTGNWTKIGNREYRLSPNSLGMNRVSVESKPARTVRLYRATGTNGNLEASLDGGQEFAGQWFTDNPTKPQHYASMTVKRAKRAGVDNPVELQYIDIPESELNKYRASEILKGRTDIEYEPTEDFLIPLDYPRQRVPLEGYTGNYLQDARRPLPELDIKSTTPQITAENAASITPEQWTAAQDAAIARGDMAEAQRLRDLHFKTKASKNKLIDENGNPVVVKHHGNVWNVFDPDRTMSGTLWTANEDAFKLSDIKTFPASDLPTEWKNLYINMKNPIQDEVSIGNTRMLSEIRKGSKDAIKESIRDYGISNPDGVFKRIKITKDFLKKNGYDLNDQEIQEILNNPEFYGKEPTMAATAYPNNIKLADAVTYDNNGVRIPLGERDNFSINDIRYGLIPFGIGLTGYGLYNVGNEK